MADRPTRDVDSADLPWVAGVTHRFVDVPGVVDPVRLHVAEAGEGDAVLMLHGWPEHWYCWRHVVPELSQRYRLLMADLRGFGWSDAPGYGYDPLTFVEDAIALLDRLGLDRVRLVGHDWGGFTAFLLGVTYPERVERIVVFNAPPLWARLTPKVIGSMWRAWYVLTIASPVRATDPYPSSVHPVVRSTRRAPAVFTPEEGNVYARRLQDPARARASCLLYRNYVRTARDVFIHRRYDGRQLTIPTLLIFGTDDFIVPRSYISGFEHHAPTLEADFVAGCGHFLPEERPDLAVSRLREFLA